MKNLKETVEADEAENFPTLVKIQNYIKGVQSFFTNRLKLNVVTMLKIFKNVIHYESSKIVNYIFVCQKLGDEKIKEWLKNF